MISTPRIRAHRGARLRPPEKGQKLAMSKNAQRKSSKSITGPRYLETYFL